MPGSYSDLNTNLGLFEQQPEPRAIDSLELIRKYLLSRITSLRIGRFSSRVPQAASSSRTPHGHQRRLTLLDDSAKLSGHRPLAKREYASMSASSTGLMSKDHTGTMTKKQRNASAQPRVALTHIVNLIDSAERDFKNFNTQKAKDTLATAATLLTGVNNNTVAAITARFRSYMLFSEIYHDLGQIDIARTYVAEGRDLLDQSAYFIPKHQWTLLEITLIIQRCALHMTERTIVVFEQDVLAVSKKPKSVRRLLELALVKLDKLGISGIDPLRANILLHLGCACFYIDLIEDGIRYWTQLCAIPGVDDSEDKRLSNIIQICRLLLQSQEENHLALNCLEKAKIWITQYLPNFYPEVFLGRINLSLAYALRNEKNKFEDAQQEATYALNMFEQAELSDRHSWIKRNKRILLVIEWLKTIDNDKYKYSDKYKDESFFIVVDRTIDREECKALAEALINPHCQLDQLCIEDCTIQYDDLLKLAKAFRDKRCGVKGFILDGYDTENMKAYDLNDLFVLLIASNLIELNIFRCGLDKYDAEIIAETMLVVDTCLTTLSLKGNCIKGKGAMSLTKILVEEKCKLTKLDLSDNSINNQGACALATALTHENCKLTHLDLADNYIDNKGLQALATALSNPNCRLVDLNLNDNLVITLPIEDGIPHESDRQGYMAGIKALIMALTSPHCHLTALHLRNMTIGDDCLPTLVNAILHPNCKLTYLDLSDNEISDVGLQVLIDVLAHPDCKLTHVYIKNNLFTDVGMIALTNALKHPGCKLTHLKIGGTKLTDASMIALAEALQHPDCQLTSVQFLRLENILGPEAIAALAVALQSPYCKLTSVDISFPAEFENIIVNAIQNNRSLTEVFDIIHFSETACQQIEAYCERNRLNQLQRKGLLFDRLLPWAFFNPQTEVAAESVSKVVGHHLSDDADVTAETQADNVTGISACSLDP